ncbi:transposase [Marinimicrobium sp. C2-29]|uniref:transposase n=1 Tax=Marinimicrobium sp. C2-29 TaxID=3139825 RepID=UPI003138D04B
MPRRARHYLAGFPYHIVQRGNNRQNCFLDDEDHQFYLELWQKQSERYGAQVHAYCLMTNHIHFLATPLEEDALSATMKVVGSRYAQFVNRKYERTGTLWEGRHRASLIETGRYLLCCYRYIELNPVRAGMVSAPEEYPWSSYAANALNQESWIVPHSDYLSLGSTEEARSQNYQSLFNQQLNHEDIKRFRKGAHYCHPVGSQAFLEEVESRYNLRVGKMGLGRPRKRERLNKGDQ